MELLGNNPSMQDLIEKLNEVVESLNNSLPNTDSEIAEVKKLVSFGSGVLAGRLNAKLWYFRTQELMTASTELCEGDSCFVLKDGATTGEGTFEYWYIYKTSDVVDIIDSYVDLSNPDLVAVKLQDMTLKDVKDTLSAQISDQSKDLNTKISNLRTDTETALSGKADLVNGLIPASQLPSYVDDIVESWLEDIEFPENAYAKEDTEMTTPLTPEFSKIYVNLLNNKTYRWGGSFYVEVSKSLAIGETATTAFAGNRGKVVEENVTVLNTGFSELKLVPFSSRCTNSAPIISELLAVCSSYEDNNDNLYYGHYSACDYNEVDVSKGIDSNGRKQIDCSSFVELVLSGIRYESSRYVIDNNLFVSNYCYTPYLTQEEAKEQSWAKYRLSYQQAKLAYDKGYCFKPNYDFSNVQPGDVIFLYDNEYPSETQWMGIDHVMIYIGRYGSNDDLHFYECGGVNGNMVSRSSSGVVHRSTRTLASMIKRTIFVARFPLGIASGNDNNVTYKVAFPQLPETFKNEEATQFYPCEEIKQGEWYTVIALVNAKNGNPFFVTDSGHLFAKTGIDCPTILINTFRAKNDFHAFRIGSYNDGDTVVWYNIAIVKGYCNYIPNRTGKYHKSFNINTTVTKGTTTITELDLSSEPILSSFLSVNTNINSQWPNNFFVGHKISGTTLIIGTYSDRDGTNSVPVEVNIDIF